MVGMKKVVQILILIITISGCNKDKMDKRKMIGHGKESLEME